MTRTLLTILCSFFILAMATTAHGRKSSSGNCAHSFVAQKQEVYLSDGSHPLSYMAKTTSQEQQHREARQLSQQQWRPMSIQLDTVLVTNPADDIDVGTGKAYSCTGTDKIVYAGGDDAGVDCFDPATGARVYQDFCRMYCTANETLTADKKTLLRDLVSGATSFMQGRLEVPATDNGTIRVISSAQRSCGGTSLSAILPGRDLLVMVTARPTRNLGSGVDAVAVSCQVHEGSNRPVLVHLNINPAALFDTTQRDTERVTADGQSRKYPDLFDDIVHQLFHAFGFSNTSYPLFKHPENINKTYTEFDSVMYPTGPVSGAGVKEQTGGSFVVEADAVEAGEKIYFKGPTVLRVAKNYFGCSTVDSGVELENGGGSGTVTGVHWEKRIFFQELLLGTPAPQQYLSMFSWALLQDTGYFNVPHIAANSYVDKTAAMQYGRGMGCSWMTEKCSKWNSNYFCSTANTASCGFDRTFLAICDLRSFANPVAAPYQYFPADATLGGPDGLADNCPMNRLMEFGECTAAANAGQLGGDREAKQGMNFGAHSSCFINRIVSTSYSQPGGAALSGCYQSFCGGAGNGHKAYIVVGKETAPCVSDNEIVELFPPVRFNKANFTPTTDGATLQLSYNYHGMLQCGTLQSYCASGVSGGKNISIPIIKDVLPVVEKVEPAWGDPTGGTVVTIVGQRMSRCTKAIVGGVALKDFVVVNETAVKGALQNVGQQYGGPKRDDGTGDALVELQCYLYDVPVCSSSGGCIVTRTKGVFNYSFTDPNIPLTVAAGVFSDFFDSIPGKIVGIIMCVVVILLLIFLARMCFKDGHKIGDKLMEEDHEEEKEEDDKKDDGKDDAAAAADATVAAVAVSPGAAAAGGAAAAAGVATGQADYVPPGQEEDDDDDIDIEQDLANLTGQESQEMTVYI